MQTSLKNKKSSGNFEWRIREFWQKNHQPKELQIFALEIYEFFTPL